MASHVFTFYVVMLPVTVHPLHIMNARAEVDVNPRSLLPRPHRRFGVHQFAVGFLRGGVIRGCIRGDF